MRKSIKDYTIYFFTIVIGVAIFYIFNSLGVPDRYDECVCGYQRDH